MKLFFSLVYIRFGRPGVDTFVQHDIDSAVIQILFLVNEGALVTVCADDSVHLWNIRQKQPEIVHTLKFQKERITYACLPFQSKWLYIGTERGNVHIVNVEAFILSGYVINWNKAVEISRKSHPGVVVHLSDNPVDPNKLLIGYESGTVVLWDLKNKAADCRFQSSEKKPDDNFEKKCRSFDLLSLPPCKAELYQHLLRVHDSFIAFAGGMAVEKGNQNPCVTVIHGKTTTVLEMEHSIIDFITLCETPWPSAAGSSGIGKGTTFVMAHFKIPDEVFTLTTLTRPSLPGNTSRICPIDQSKGLVLGSFKRTS
ncbi:syntaxin-binding protein 5 [Trichonephila inaurata madagascariensis]|uniref:Syntaxin-binding protein 5 n=1 Tax=Trichonephila inaurata madagascariensis TaxID=2747483 RepID=A0A8X6MLR4_9ARAC|nr:syntaxin-binding protein 5 [Trichonephila inaurata madagascariensis]